MAGKKNKRFVVTYSQDLETIQVLQDTVTGVNYLMTGQGMIVLIDENGKPLVTVPESKDTEVK